MRLTSFTFFVAAAVLFSASTRGDTPAATLTVEAGNVSRRNAPVAAKVDIKPELAKAAGWSLVKSPASASGGMSIAAQVEPTADGAIIRWIEPDLQAGASKKYDLVPADVLVGDTLRFVPGDGWRDLIYGDKGVWRHMNRFDPADHANTFKPFHHVYGMRGEGFITNGPGSEEWGAKGEGIRYPHHRGLFFAYNKTPYGDFWHGKGGVSQRHKAYEDDREFAGPVVAREVSVNEWTTKDGKPVVRDTRAVTAWRVSEGHVVLDFDVTLESLTDEAIPLGGDAQHAGFHFRAANSVGQDPAATKPTTRGNTGGSVVYTRPETAVDVQDRSKDVWGNCPWVHAAFTVKGNPYGVMQMNHPSNPQPTVFSTRPYGRFGAFVNDQQVAPGKPLNLKYRFVVRDDGAKVDAKQLEAEYQNWISPVKVAVSK